MRIKGAAKQQSLTCKPQIYSLSTVHCKKKLQIFPSPAGRSFTKPSLARDGKIYNLFYSEKVCRGTYIDRISPLVIIVTWFVYIAFHSTPVAVITTCSRYCQRREGGERSLYKLSLTIQQILFSVSSLYSPFPLQQLLYMYTQLYSKVSPAAMRLKSICCIFRISNIFINQTSKASCQNNEILFHIQ